MRMEETSEVTELYVQLLQACHDVVRVAVTIRRAPESVAEGKPHIHSAGISEARRDHADDGVCLAAERNGASQNPGVAAESSPATASR